MAKCEKCGRIMNTIHWGRGKDMAICINSACELYRRPCTNPFYATSGKASTKAQSEKLPEHEFITG